LSLFTKPRCGVVTSIGSLSGSWFGGVLAQNGKIYGIPNNSLSILEIDTSVGIATTLSNVGVALSSCAGGVLSKGGKIYCIPRNGGAIGVINIATQSFSASSMSLPTGATYNGATLAPSGIIYVSPYTSGSLIYKITFSGLNQLPFLNYCLTPYINKF
jgi:hypothetical protein